MKINTNVEIYTISNTSQKIINELAEKFGIMFSYSESQKGRYYFYGTKEKHPCHTTFDSWKKVSMYLQSLKNQN